MTVHEEFSSRSLSPELAGRTVSTKSRLVKHRETCDVVAWTIVCRHQKKRIVADRLVINGIAAFGECRRTASATLLQQQRELIDPRDRRPVEDLEQPQSDRIAEVGHAAKPLAYERSESVYRNARPGVRVVVEARSAIGVASTAALAPQAAIKRRLSVMSSPRLSPSVYASSARPQVWVSDGARHQLGKNP